MGCYFRPSRRVKVTCEARRSDLGAPYWLDPMVQRVPNRYSPLMPLLTVVLTLVVVGVVLWLINTYIPMQGTIKKILNIVVVIVVILWLLYGFGVLSSSGDIRLPKVS